jgi:hypothetical protein
VNIKSKENQRNEILPCKEIKECPYAGGEHVPNQEEEERTQAKVKTEATRSR